MSLRMFSKLIENVLKLRAFEQISREDVRVWRKLETGIVLKKNSEMLQEIIFQEKEHLLYSLLSVKQ